MKVLKNSFVEVGEYEKGEKKFKTIILHIGGFSLNVKPSFDLTKSQYRALMNVIDFNTTEVENEKK